MLRFLLLIIVVMTLFVFMRLVLLRLKMMESQTSASPKGETQSRTIDAPAPLEVRDCKFKNFDSRIGPSNPDNFLEELQVEVGHAGSAKDAGRSYALHVGTPSALNSALRTSAERYKFGRNLLIVERYDMQVILRAVRQHINELGLLGEDVS